MLNAQITLPCLSSDFCNYDLTNPLPNIEIITTPNPISYAKANSSFRDVKYKDDALPANNCMVGVMADDCSPSQSALVYKVTYPTNYNYILCGGLPTIIFVHGGGISDCSNYIVGDNGLNYLIDGFAKRGFVVFNVEYRRGRITYDVPPYYNTVQESMANYRAAQDVRGAIRSIIKRQMKEGQMDGGVLINDPYRIDLDRIFLAGNSGGSVSVLSAAFYETPQMVSAVFPNSASSQTMASALGPIDVDFYYGETTIDYFSKIKAVLNLWGAFYLPNTVTNPSQAQSFFANNSHFPAVISFHGRKDVTIPSKTKLINFAPTNEALYNKETFCVNPPYYQVFNSANSNILHELVSVGSEDLFAGILMPLKIPCELYVDCQMEHGPDCEPDFDPNDKCTNPFRSDFGTGATDREGFYTYIVQRTCAFFQAALSGAAYINNQNKYSLGNNIFIECVNQRKKCLGENYIHNCCDDCNNSSSTTDKCSSNYKL